MIKLICSYPYDNNYDYTKLFSNKEQQKTYFNNLKNITEIEYSEENDQGYIKEGDSFCVGHNYDFLVNEGVNYVIFNNGYKDIYAFITSKEFLNDELTRLNYEIDVLQTFLFDITLNKSFIERKVCSISEITDFDEGLNIGEHIIDTSTHIFDKDSTYFAMFNGIKEQQIIFNDSGKISDVIQLPFPTSKPLTIVDDIAYPLYFMPLLEQSHYEDARLENIDVPNVSQSKVVNSAIKCIGMRYVWGGNLPPFGSDDGTDCSGLCQWAYYDANLYDKVNLGGRWTTYTMYPHTQDVGLYSVAPGDVMFCTWNTSGMIDVASWTDGLPGHVTIVESITRDMDNIYTINVIEALNENYPILRRSYKYDENKMKFGRLIY